MNQLRESRERIDGAIEGGEPVDQDSDVDRTSGDERSGDVKDYLRRRPLED